MIERISLELTNQCSKRCWFCYNHSNPLGSTLWQVDEIVGLLTDCANHGVRSVSLGGGEPLEYEGVYDVLAQLDGVMFRSLTTHGLALDRGALEPLVAARPDKVHVSIHFPEKDAEVERVVRHVQLLTDHGIRAGVNLLVSNKQLGAAARAAAKLHRAGVDNDRIIYLPMRSRDTPTPSEVALVAGDATESPNENPPAFQSMTCLNECGRSERFCSIRWDKTVAWCSYTTTRRGLKSLDHAGLMRAMDGLGLTYCGDDYVPLTWYATEQGSEPSNVEGELQPCSEAGGEEDFPAAHSMDTDWFATDADGHVALMESGEPGAVPKVIVEDAGLQHSEQKMIDFLLAEDADTDTEFFVDDLIEMGPGKIYRPLEGREPLDTPLEARLSTVPELRRHDDRPPFKRSILRDQTGLGGLRTRGWREPHVTAVCWLTDELVLTALRERTSHKRFKPMMRILPTSNHVFALAQHIPQRIICELFEGGKIVAAILDSYQIPIHRFGFYQFMCFDYNSAPYDRIAVPPQPVSVSQLRSVPPHVCGYGKFESLCFRDTPRLQPAEHMPCESWDALWTDLQGNTHRFDETT